MGHAGGYYGDNDRDGDLTQIVYDRNGVVSGRAQSYVVRSDNLLLNTATCCPASTVHNAAVCSDLTLGQVRGLHQRYWRIQLGPWPQTSDEIFCFAKNRFQDKLADSSGCHIAKRHLASGSFAPGLHWRLCPQTPFYRASICEGGLGSRNSVCLSVCPSVCHTRGL